MWYLFIVYNGWLLLRKSKKSEMGQIFPYPFLRGQHLNYNLLGCFVAQSEWVFFHIRLYFSRYSAIFKTHSAVFVPYWAESVPYWVIFVPLGLYLCLTWLYLSLIRLYLCLIVIELYLKSCITMEQLTVGNSWIDKIISLTWNQVTCKSTAVLILAIPLQ